MRRLLFFMFIGIMLLAGCNSNTAPSATPPDPISLLDDAIKGIRATKSFRMTLEQTGADYVFAITVDPKGGAVNAVLRRAEAQFVAPNVLYANVDLLTKVLGTSIGLKVEVFARGPKQAFRLPATAWIFQPFAADFNPDVLLAENSGFQKALSSLLELKFVGNESLDDGTPVFHVSGRAPGSVVKDLLVGLVDTGRDVTVDVSLDQTSHLPLKLVITLPDSATKDQPDNTQWQVEVYDFNAEPQYVDPEATPSS